MGQGRRCQQRRAQRRAGAATRGAGRGEGKRIADGGGGDGLAVPERFFLRKAWKDQADTKGYPIGFLLLFYADGPFLPSNFNGWTCSNPSWRSFLQRHRLSISEHPMFDLVLVAAGIGLFGLMIGYASACERL